MDKNQMPDDFHKLVKDFIGDLLNTFPEYKEKLNEDMDYIANNDFDADDFQRHITNIFDYCSISFPERFFDILYKNEIMFDLEKREDNYNTEFFPGVDFSDLWKCDISERTKDILWRYLQITLFAVIGNMKDHVKFGDTAKLFEAIDENDLQHKITETFENFSTMFDLSSNGLFNDISGASGLFEGDGIFGEDGSGNGMHDYMNNLPKPEDMHEHISGMLNGKLGRLAQDIAAETTDELDFKDEKNVGDVFEKLIKNPTKIMNLVKKIGKKIDDKIKAGDINESELMMEANEMMNKMKQMPGMNGMEDIMNKMAGNLGGKGAKFNMNAFNQKNKVYSQKERMTQELERRRAAKKQAEFEKVEKESEEIKFSAFKPEGAEAPVKSSVTADASTASSGKKKKRCKKKK
tara:strand:+ start:760 stop:1977 length:1218 start_codon:yes stop_codon:yes gene_type:complete